MVTDSDKLTTFFVVNQVIQGAIDLVSNHFSNRRTKHIHIRFHHTRKALRNGGINLKYCATENMTADLVTKPLGHTKLSKLVEQGELQTYKFTTRQ